jgi:UDP-N-acetylglucosamine acyltransferase
MKKTDIHPSAIISHEAKIGDEVIIGPYCVVGPHVTLSDHVKLGPHVVINGHTHIGSGTHILSFSCIGDPPQDRSYEGENSQLFIGSDNRIGHYVTINGGTKKSGLITRVGDNCMIMDNTHIGHDAHIGNHVTLTNAVLLAGHVKIEDDVVIGGDTAVLQHVHIGKGAMIGYANGYPATLDSLNIIGMKRLKISAAEIHALRLFYKTVLCKQKSEATFEKRFSQFKSTQNITNQKNSCVHEVMQFIEADTKKPLCLPQDNE